MKCTKCPIITLPTSTSSTYFARRSYTQVGLHAAVKRVLPGKSDEDAQPSDDVLEQLVQLLGVSFLSRFCSARHTCERVGGLGIKREVWAFLEPDNFCHLDTKPGRQLS